MTPAPKRPPFTRLPTSDPVLNDLYDKLNSVALQINPSTGPTTGEAAPASTPSPASSQSSPNVRVIENSDTLLASDTTVLAILSAIGSIILPELNTVLGKIFTIKNSAQSAAALNLQSPSGQKVDGADAGTISLAIGEAIVLQATALDAWIILSRLP